MGHNSWNSGVKLPVYVKICKSNINILIMANLSEKIMNFVFEFVIKPPFYMTA